MSKKSNTITIRFSNEELKKIEEFMTKHKIKTRNDFVRHCIGITTAVFEWADSPEAEIAMKNLQHGLTEFDNVLSNDKKTKAKLKAKWTMVNQNYMSVLEKSMDLQRKRSEPFAKKRKRGHPKVEKRHTPGRKSRKDMSL